MADTITNSYELQFDWLFMDGDTRVQTLKNPKEEITTAEIQALETLILNGGTSTLLVGDKTNAAFRRIETVTRRNTQKITLDIS